MTQPSDSLENINFEKALDELSGLVKQLEQGNLPLEQSVLTFEAGMKLIQHCQLALKNAQQKIQLLTKEQEAFHLQQFSIGSDDV